MVTTNGRSETAPETVSPAPESVTPDAKPSAPADGAAAAAPAPRPWRKWLLRAGIVAGLALGGYLLIPWAVTSLQTISTDDAYINGHVTFVAPRVAGQVITVLVDDNQRVKKGDVLVQLDKEPYQVQVNIKNAAVLAAEADLGSAEAQARGQIANLGANVATLNSKKATLGISRPNLARGEELTPAGAMSREEFQQRQQTVKVDDAGVAQALQTVYASRVSLGLPAQPTSGRDLAETPADLDQHDPQGILNHVYDRLVRDAPAVKQAEAKVLQARSDLAQAELNLRYCDVVSDIDGQVTGRNVNPGNNVQMGQSLLAVRSVTEIWIDANFKETQLAALRIGQRVRCEIDMYGSLHEFQGRITGFTMGTGQTLALLPPQNATGNYVKIVQRLPVRIELTDYDPDKNPLFVGLSVFPYVYFKEPPTGAQAGDVLQPYAALPQSSANPQP